jgi:hypothetical protein
MRLSASRRGGVLRVRVRVRQDGALRPVRGAVVRAGGRRHRTDAGGRTAFRGVAGHGTIRARHPDLRPASLRR